MAEPSLKVISDAPAITDAKKPPAKKAFSRKRLRMVLLIVVPRIVPARSRA